MFLLSLSRHWKRAKLPGDCPLPRCFGPFVVCGRPLRCGRCCSQYSAHVSSLNRPGTSATHASCRPRLAMRRRRRGPRARIMVLSAERPPRRLLGSPRAICLDWGWCNSCRVASESVSRLCVCAFVCLQSTASCIGIDNLHHNSTSSQWIVNQHTR